MLIICWLKERITFVINHSYSGNVAKKFSQRFENTIHGANPNKIFVVNLITLFCKLFRFIITQKLSPVN